VSFGVDDDPAFGRLEVELVKALFQDRERGRSVGEVGVEEVVEGGLFRSFDFSIYCFVDNVRMTLKLRRRRQSRLERRRSRPELDFVRRRTVEIG